MDEIQEEVTQYENEIQEEVTQYENEIQEEVTQYENEIQENTNYSEPENCILTKHTMKEEDKIRDDHATAPDMNAMKWK